MHFVCKSGVKEIYCNPITQFNRKLKFMRRQQYWEWHSFSSLAKYSVRTDPKRMPSHSQTSRVLKYLSRMRLGLPLLLQVSQDDLHSLLVELDIHLLQREHLCLHLRIHFVNLYSHFHIVSLLPPTQILLPSFLPQ